MRGITAATALKGEAAMVTFRLGDAVRIRSGPLASFVGRVEGINQAKTLLKVRVEIFGRETPVKLKFKEVEKAEPRPPFSTYH